MFKIWIRWNVISESCQFIVLHSLLVCLIGMLLGLSVSVNLFFLQSDTGSIDSSNEEISTLNNAMFDESLQICKFGNAFNCTPVSSFIQ
jgi:hypothetical protein